MTWEFLLLIAGSRNYEKARRKYDKAWERLRNRRDDFRHKTERPVA